MCIRDSFHNSHRELCALFLVEAQEVGIVLLADLIAGQDDHILGIVAVDEADVLVDGVCSALVPVGAVCLLVRGQGVHTAVQTDVYKRQALDGAVFGGLNGACAVDGLAQCIDHAADHRLAHEMCIRDRCGSSCPSGHPASSPLPAFCPCCSRVLRSTTCK